MQYMEMLYEEIKIYINTEHIRKIEMFAGDS